MSISRKYSLYAVRLNDAADVLISGVTSQGLDTGSQVDAEVTGAEVYPRWYALTGQNPGGRFATHHLATALTNIGMTGLSIASLQSGLELILQKHAEGGMRAGALSHRIYGMTEGLIVPGTISCLHGPGQHASVDYRIVLTWDGSNEPFTVTDSQTLPTAEDDDERFAIGPWFVGGVTIDHLRGVTIDCGVNVVTEGGDGDLYPTFASIPTITPVLRLNGIDPEWLKAANIPLTGKVGTHANTIGYFRKRSATGFVANATAQHIKFTAAGLAYIENAFDASGVAAAECSLVMPLRYDGTNAPLTINTASAIT